ncbi:MAG: hypothetical protein GXY39_05555 [Actinomycetales bacterium]|nr:hypothetical protein [Tetrasphaera sp.]NLW99155.1 hypothetical protein [Actinomycetales bacterium]
MSDDGGTDRPDTPEASAVRDPRAADELAPDQYAASGDEAGGLAVDTDATDADEVDEHEALLEAFWQNARMRARFDWLGAYGGLTVLGALRPPAWAFGSTPEDADAFVEEVLSRATVATAEPLSDYETAAGPQPEVGAVAILLDGSGSPRALVATSDVSVVTLGELPHEELAVPVQSEGLDPRTQFVLERLTLLYPTKRHR